MVSVVYTYTSGWERIWSEKKKKKLIFREVDDEIEQREREWRELLPAILNSMDKTYWKWKNSRENGDVGRMSVGWDSKVEKRNEKYNTKYTYTWLYVCSPLFIFFFFFAREITRGLQSLPLRWSFRLVDSTGRNIPRTNNAFSFGRARIHGHMNIYVRINISIYLYIWIYVLYMWIYTTECVCDVNMYICASTIYIRVFIRRQTLSRWDASDHLHSKENKATFHRVYIVFLLFMSLDFDKQSQNLYIIPPININMYFFFS